MARRRINSMYDVSALTSESEKIAALLDTIGKKLQGFPKIKLQLEGSDNLKSRTQALTELQQNLKQMEGLQNELAKSKARLNVLETEAARTLAQSKIALQENNAAMKDSIKLEQAKEGSLNQLRLQLKQVQKEYDALSASERNAAKGQDLLRQLQTLDTQLKDLEFSSGRFQRNVGNYQGSAKIIADAFERSKQKVEQFNRSLAPTSPEAQAARREFEALQRITDNPQFLNVAARVGDASKEIRFFTQQLNNLETAGLKNSEVYLQVQERLANLTDQVQDTKTEIRALASDSRNFDLFAGSVNFAADAFQTAAGAIQLFGGSEQDAAQATATLVAIQSVSNGVKSIANELTTKGTAANKAFALVQRQVNIVMTEGIVTANGLKAALSLLAIAATVIGVIAISLAAFNRSADAAAQRQKNLNDVMKDAGSEYAKATELVHTLRNEIELAKQGFVSKEGVVKHYNETIGKTTGAVKTLQQAESDLSKNADAYIEMMKAKAIATAAFAKASQLAVDQQLELITQGKPEDDPSLQLLKNLGFRKGDTRFDEAVKGIVDGRKALQAEAKRQIDELFKFGDEADKKAADIGKKFKFNFFDNPDGGGGGGGDKGAADRNAKARHDALVLELQQQAEIQRQIVSIDTFSNSDRIDAFRKYIELKRQIINSEADFELKKIGLTAGEIQLIEKKRSIDLANAGNDIISLFKDEGKKAVEAMASEMQFLPDEIQKALDETGKKLDDFFEKSMKGAGVITQREWDKVIEQLKNQEKLDEIKNAYIDTFQIVATSFDNLIGGMFDRRKNKIQDEIDLIDKQKQADIDRINASTDSEEKKAARIKIIEAKAQADHDALERKQRELDRRKAIAAKAFNVFQVTIDALQAIRKAELDAQLARMLFLAHGGPFVPAAAPYGVAAALATAQALQTKISGFAAIVAAAATPIPKFGEGTDSAPGGLSVVGERGRELGIDPHGRLTLYKGPTLTNLMKGTKILPNEITERVIRAAEYERQLMIDHYHQQSISDNRDLLEQTVKELKSMNKKPPIIIHNERDITSTAYFLKTFKH
jgi:hypothetical protein